MSAGFVLAGGKSSRLGVNKALLPWAGTVLAAHIARRLSAVCPAVTLIGDPDVYGYLGFPVVSDLTPGCGPIGGLHSALSLRLADWNLLAACDMPYITEDVFSRLLNAALDYDGLCVVPVDSQGSLQPLCALYHAAALSATSDAVRSGLFKMKNLVASLPHKEVPGFPRELFLNINTPDDWAAAAGRGEG